MDARRYSVKVKHAVWFLFTHLSFLYGTESNSKTVMLSHFQQPVPTSAKDRVQNGLLYTLTQRLFFVLFLFVCVCVCVCV